MISTHILDLNSGSPAQGVKVCLELKKDDEWTRLSENETNDDGRVSFDNEAVAGDYRLIFALESYQKANDRDCFFKVAPVEFCIKNTNRKYHIPLLLNNFGYSTYRGS